MPRQPHKKIDTPVNNSFLNVPLMYEEIRSTLFQTSDLAFAAYLQTIGFKIKAIERRSNRVTWTFDVEIHGGEDLYKTFIAGAEVPAANYFLQIKNLKSSIYQI